MHRFIAEMRVVGVVLHIMTVSFRVGIPLQTKWADWKCEFGHLEHNIMDSLSKSEVRIAQL